MPTNLNQPCPLSQDAVRHRSKRCTLASWIAAMSMMASALTAIPVTATAQSPPSTWKTLPDSTLAAVRIVGAQEIVQRLNEETKLGAVLLKRERGEQLIQWLEDRSAAASDESPLAMLREYDFEPGNVVDLFAGECGLALVRADEPSFDSKCYVVGWISPEADLQDLLWATLRQWVDRAEDESQAVRVTAFDTHGAQVISMQVPSSGPDDADEEDASVADHNIIFANADGRLVALFGGDAPDRSSLDEQSELLLEQLEGCLEREAGDREGFANRMGAAPGVQSELHAGEEPVFELVGDGGEILRWSEQSVPDASRDSFKQGIEAAGVRDIGPFAYRWTLGEGLMREYGFVSLPVPRSGYMKVFEQEPLPVDPPAWVPASIVSYAQMGADLAEVYRVVKQETLAIFPQSRQAFDLVQTQVQAMLQTDVESLLASPGTKHVEIQLTPKLVPVGLGGEQEIEAYQDRVAYVWPMKDEALWNRVMTTLGNFAAGLQMEPTNEQGFHGYRIENPLLQGGIVMNSNYLVLGVGQGVLETVLSSLNHPPREDDALRNSALYRRAQQLVDFRPALSFEISDGERLMRVLRDGIEPTLQQFQRLGANDAQDSDVAGWTQLAIELLPSDREMEDVLGVVVRELVVDEQGFVLHGVTELPPRE